MATEKDNQLLREEVRGIQADLTDAGWQVANSLGEQVSPDRVKWFVAVYTHGEYTVEASHRPRGYGKSEGVTRIRITPTMLQNHPGLGKVLAGELIDADSTQAWPPTTWAKLS